MKERLVKGPGGFYYTDSSEKDVKLGKDLERSFFLRKNASQDFFGEDPYKSDRVKFKTGGNVDIKIKHPGALHKEMGIPEDEKIPLKKLKSEKRKADAENDTLLKKRVNFALNFRGKKK